MAVRTNCIKSITKVKAHNKKAITDVNHPQHWEAKANDAADAACKAAACMHPMPREGLRRDMALDFRISEAVLKMSLQILILWPKVGDEEMQIAKRLQKSAAKTKGPRQHGKQHLWWPSLNGKNWQCVDCGVVRFTERKPPGYVSECRGDPAVARLVYDNHGHTLIVGDASGLPFAVCVSCGGFATTRPKVLAAECMKPIHRSKAGNAVIRNVMRMGRLPPPFRTRITTLFRVESGGIHPVPFGAAAEW